MFEGIDLSNKESEEYQHWRQSLLHLVPKLNYDAIIELSYQLAFVSKLNDKQIWSAVENAALENINRYETKHICKLLWSVTQLKSKQSSTYLDKMLK